MVLDAEQVTAITQMLKANVPAAVICDLLSIDPRTLDALAKRRGLKTSAPRLGRIRVPQRIERQAKAFLDRPEMGNLLAMLESLEAPGETALFLRAVAERSRW